MNKKQGAGVSVAAVIVALTGLVGASEGGFLNFNSSEVNINTNIDSHDVITGVINQFGLDVTPDELQTLCGGSNLEEPLKTACDVISRNTNP